ncbi:MAG TPA: DUF3106 domain-containing protein [Rickettsia endosymbiont of Pyrocoelia pectoralis]|nr:DUF3106 domain-containing protein [Rickettsia endosymbiont of Pyrocoelia pectoralis]
MPNIAEKISPEDKENADKFIESYKNLTPEEQRIVDKKLKNHFDKEESKKNDLSLVMSNIFKNLSGENQKTLQAGNNPISEIAGELVPLIKGIINFIDNIAKVIKNPVGAVYEWFKNELNQVKPQQQNYQQLMPQQKQNTPATAALSR